MTRLPLPAAARLRVAIDEGDGGALTLCALGRAERRRTVLEWSRRALDDGDDAGANLAVRQAPLVSGVHRVGKPELFGLPGFLADSLPDSWGRLLVDHELRRSGFAPNALTGLDRLAIVGRRGPGALTFEPEAPLSTDDIGDIDLDALARASHLVLEGEDAGELLAALERAGGSAGGSRPKAWIAEDEAGRLRSGAGPLQPGETGWLVKFRARVHDPEDIGPIELAYGRMASAAGLIVAEPRLFETARGRYFASKRFDRDGSRRVHVMTAAGLLDVAAEEAVAADYVDLIKLTRHVTRSEPEALETYRHAVFNVLAHNRDDHLKQFAFYRKQGRWLRTPAYDLTFSQGPGGEHTLLVAGEGRAPKNDHLVALAARAGVAPAAAQRVVGEVRAAVGEWGAIAEAAGVSAASRRTIGETLERIR